VSQSKYFREELSFLREQGKKFTEIHPQLSRFLNGSNTDPDVERLLEGFAFLTSRLREKVEDEFPELTHSMINMLWPNYLRPVPSMSIVKFTADQSISVMHKIISGTQLDSKKISSTRCKFRTCRDVDVYPMECIGITAHHSREASTIDLKMLLNGQLSVEDIKLGSLRFYLGGDKYSSEMLYLWLNNYLNKITLIFGEKEVTLNSSYFSMVGFNNDGMLPYPKNVYDGYRIIQEYLSFPNAFYFFDLNGLADILPASFTEEFTIRFSFNKTLASGVKIDNDSFQLYCTPIVNLFEHDADPIDLTGKKSEYRVVPSSRNPSHFEVFSTDEVTGWLNDKSQKSRIKGEKRVYSSFESFQHEIERVRNRTALYYRMRVKESTLVDGFDNFISFVRGDESIAYEFTETVALKLTCTNRQLPISLEIGDICYPTETSPAFAEFKNITIPSQPLRPVLDGSLLWTLISNLSLNYLSLLSKDALSSVLKAYDFKALVDRQAERIGQMRIKGIVSIESIPTDRLVQGLPVRGLKSTITLDQNSFSSEGDLFLFGTVLSKFFALYASINSFHELVVINATNNEIYTWGIQEGMQPLI